MSDCWCNWCNLSSKEWSDKSHGKGLLYTIELMKESLNDQKINEQMTPYEINGYVKTLLFDSVPIENYRFSLLHAEIGIGNNIIYS